MKFQLRKVGNNIVYLDTALFASVFFLIFIVPFFPESNQNSLYSVFITIIYLLAALSVGGRGKRYLLLIAGILMVLEWLSDLLKLVLINDISRTLTAIFFMIIVVNFIIGIARAKLVTTKIILDAINGYLLLSIVFTILVVIMMRFDPLSFSFPDPDLAQDRANTDFNNYMYYTLVSVTTLGYGDIVPKAPYAKSLATLISITGQFYIAILVALLVGKYASGRK